jgi:RimJ/RimL family protein N-acetyltransferase
MELERITIVVRKFHDISDADITVLTSILNNDEKLRVSLGIQDKPQMPVDEFKEIGARWMVDNLGQVYCIYSDQPVGTISISQISPEGQARVGYWLTSTVWHKGYGTSVFEWLLSECKRIGICEISARIGEENIPSLKLWRKFGGSTTLDGNQFIGRLQLG